MAYATSNYRVIPFARKPRRGLGDMQMPSGNFMVPASAFGPTASTNDFINSLTAPYSTLTIPNASGVTVASPVTSAFGGNTLLYIAGALLLAYFLMPQKG